MTTDRPQPNPDPKTLGPLLEALRQAMPGLEKLVEACKNLFPDTIDDAKPFPCNSCEERVNCNSCDKIKKALPEGNPGRGRRENLTGLHINTLQPMQKIWCLDVFDQYESCKEIFTPLQWEAIYLHYSRGLTQEQVGTQLGKTRKAISGLIQRAKARKEKHDRKIRAEKYEVMKKSIKEE